jgi:hypothetical protein
MGRRATLREKSGYWASDAGGKTRRFGKVGEVSRAEAERRLHEYLASTKTATPTVVDVPASLPTVNDLADRFLAWVLEHRGRNAHRCR